HYIDNAERQNKGPKQREAKKNLANRNRTSDRWMTVFTLQSTALPTELSRATLARDNPDVQMVDQIPLSVNVVTIRKGAVRRPSATSADIQQQQQQPEDPSASSDGSVRAVLSSYVGVEFGGGMEVAFCKAAVKNRDAGEILILHNS
ncbi:hypothetical protein THAOC_00927, partial [Thalassiosira oceanica]